MDTPYLNEETTVSNFDQGITQSSESSYVLVPNPKLILPKGDTNHVQGNFNQVLGLSLNMNATDYSLLNVADSEALWYFSIPDSNLRIPSY